MKNLMEMIQDSIPESRLEYSTKYKYKITFVDTKTDEVIAIRYGKTDLDGVKRQIFRYLNTIGFKYGYKNTDWVVIYIRDLSMDTEEGAKLLKTIAAQTYVDPELIDIRGLDFDIWHDYYLSEEERTYYDESKAR